MKKVLVLVVLFALFAGVVPARVEARILPGQTRFLAELYNMLVTSENVEIGKLRVGSETLSLAFCMYDDYGGWGDLSSCLSFTITSETEIWIDGKMGPGTIDDLWTGQTAAVEYHHQDGLVYARRMFVTNKMRTSLGRIIDIDYVNRIISWCKWSYGCYDIDPLYVPNQTLITFHWDDELHDLEDILVNDQFRVLIYEHDKLPFYIGPLIHVRRSALGGDPRP